MAITNTSAMKEIVKHPPGIFLTWAASFYVAPLSVETMLIHTWIMACACSAMFYRFYNRSPPSVNLGGFAVAGMNFNGWRGAFGHLHAKAVSSRVLIREQG